MRRSPAQLAICTMFLLAGCTVIPGMRYSGNLPETLPEYMGVSGANDTDAADGPQGYAIQRISPSLLAAENEIRLRAPTGLPNPTLDAQMAKYRYLIEPGDILSITTWSDIGDPGGVSQPSNFLVPGAPLGPAAFMSVPSQTGVASSAAGFKVDANGNIFYPYVGTVSVAGKTIADIRDQIAQRAKPLLRNPQITVDVAQFNSQRFLVSGVLVKPGLYPVTDVPITVSQAIAQAGGVLFLLPTAAQSGNTIPRPLGDLSHVLYTHDGHVSLLDIRARIERDDQTQDRLMAASDMIQVPDNDFEQVHVIGEVTVPGNYPLDDGKLNLAQALGDAGNMNLSTANFARIFVFRGAWQDHRIFWLDARSPDALLLAARFVLEPQDVVYVASTDLAQWNRIVSQILPTVQTLYETKVLLGG
jgi:polysaccharide export outer membrane protein